MLSFSKQIITKVVSESPRTQTLRRIGLVVIVSLLLVIAYFLGLTKKRLEIIKATEQQFTTQVKSLQDTKVQLQSQLTQSNSETDILNATIEQLHIDIKKMQYQYDNLSNDVNMYKNILDNSSKKRVVEVAKVQIIQLKNQEQALESNISEYLVNLTLIQKAQRRVKITGSAYIEILAVSSSGDEAILKYSDITDTNQNQYLNFNYFQNIEFKTAIPVEYNPTKLLIHVSSAQLSKPISEEYNWLEYLDLDLDLTTSNCIKPI